MTQLNIYSWHLIVLYTYVQNTSFVNKLVKLFCYLRIYIIIDRNQKETSLLSFLFGYGLPPIVLLRLLNKIRECLSIIN